MDDLPQCYSRLAPFRAMFERTPALLMYHHVGPRPRGARMKGLFVSENLFKTQLEELARERFIAPSYDTVTSVLSKGSSGRAVSSVTSAKEDAAASIFITFDDGFLDVFQNALPVLSKHQFNSIQFLVADLIGRTNEWQQRAGDVSHQLMDDHHVRDWMAAGQEIGAHTCTHPWLTKIALSAAREEIVSSKKKLEDRFGQRIDHFCYPYGDFNQQVRDFVEEAGYKTACTTRRGINEPGADMFALNRITVRYPTRSLKGIVRKVRSAFTRTTPASK